MLLTGRQVKAKELICKAQKLLQDKGASFRLSMRKMITSFIVDSGAVNVDAYVKMIIDEKYLK